MTDTFSVIILLYNNSEYVEECLCSVLEQRYPSIEIIVVDDGSKEFDSYRIEEFIKKKKSENIVRSIVYQNEKNLGTVKSANGAIKQSTGKFVKLLAADDALYDPMSLSNAANVLKDCPSGIITGDVMKCDELLKPIATYRNYLPKVLNQLEPKEVFKRLCVHNEIVAGGVFFSSIFFDHYGLFDETYRLLEDWPTWLRVTKKGCRIRYAPFYAIRYRSNNGIGTSVNPIYLSDKKKVLENIIMPSKKEIGFFAYLKARASFRVINSPVARKAYGLLFRREKQPEKK